MLRLLLLILGAAAAGVVLVPYGSLFFLIPLPFALHMVLVYGGELGIIGRVRPRRLSTAELLSELIAWTGAISGIAAVLLLVASVVIQLAVGRGESLAPQWLAAWSSFNRTWLGGFGLLGIASLSMVVAYFAVVRQSIRP